MNLIVFSLGVLAVFLIGSFLIAGILRLKYGDSSASYGLFAVRDDLIAAVVFKGVKREDPWLDALYRGVNALLWHSHFVAGPGEGWARADWIGKHLAEEPNRSARGWELPMDVPPPEVLVPIVNRLMNELDRMVHAHAGIRIQMTSQARRKLQIQRARAAELRRTLDSCKLALG